LPATRAEFGWKPAGVSSTDTRIGCDNLRNSQS
jgi:hypothetical protein